MRKVLLLVCGLLVGTAGADVATTALDVEWDTSTTGLVASGTITLPGVVSIDSMTLDLAHSWCSDFEIFVAGPDGSAWTLMMDEDSSSDLGDGAGYGLANVVEYEFVETGGANTWGAVTVNPPGTYDANTWYAGGPLSAGDYMIEVYDDAGGDGGAVGTWGINYTIPEPASLLLIGLGALALRRR